MTKLIPVPSALGGGIMPCYRNLTPAGTCTAVNCKAHATAKCRYKLDNGKACGRDVCAGCASKAGLCPAHQRKADKESGTVRPWM